MNHVITVMRSSVRCCCDRIAHLFFCVSSSLREWFVSEDVIPNTDTSFSFVNLSGIVCISHLTTEFVNFFRLQKHPQSLPVLNLKELPFEWCYTRSRWYSFSSLAQKNLSTAKKQFRDECHGDVKQFLLHGPITRHCG